jgi:DNA-binding NarL/FixJ family response regulator
MGDILDFSKANSFIVIDDNPSNLYQLSKEIKKADRNYVCHSALDSELAFEYLEESKPTAVLIDLKLGKENGIDVISELRSKGYDGFIGLLSGVEDKKIIADAIKAGANDFFKKEDFSSITVKKISNSFFKRSDSEFQ